MGKRYEYLYHATPQNHIWLIKQKGLGAVLKYRMHNMKGTQYENIREGVFLSTDMFKAEESVLMQSAKYKEMNERLKKRGENGLMIHTLKIRKDLLDSSKLKTDQTDPEGFFYEGVIPWKQIKTEMIT